MSFFRSLFGGGGGGPNPADAGMGYLNRIPGETRPYYQPFIESGQQASNIANPVYGQMTQNPNDFLNAIMRNYNPSEGYRYKQREMERAMANSQAAGGFIGTPYAQQQQAEQVQGLLGQDMQEFLRNILGIQGAGLEGQENRMNRGYNASNDYANVIGTNLGNQAQLAFQGQAQQNANNMARRNARMNFFGGLARTGANMFGGGF
jgi:hypothetical protein